MHAEMEELKKDSVALLIKTGKAMNLDHLVKLCEMDVQQEQEMNKLLQRQDAIDGMVEVRVAVEGVCETIRDEEQLQCRERSIF